MRRHGESKNCSISTTDDKSGNPDKFNLHLTINKGVDDLITGVRQEPSHNNEGTTFYFVEFEEKHNT